MTGVHAPEIKPATPLVILFGIGNCGRNDDGLGWAFLDRIQTDVSFPGLLEYRYHLQVEDAALIRDADRVIFVDSNRGSLPAGWAWQPCEASADFQFTTHALPPQAVLFLCQDLYQKSPPADLLIIEGVSWKLQTGLSDKAAQNLESALRFFSKLVGSGYWPESSDSDSHKVTLSSEIRSIGTSPC